MTPFSEEDTQQLPKPRVPKYQPRHKKDDNTGVKFLLILITLVGVLMIAAYFPWDSVFTSSPTKPGPTVTVPGPTITETATKYKTGPTSVITATVTPKPGETLHVTVTPTPQPPITVTATATVPGPTVTAPGPTITKPGPTKTVTATPTVTVTVTPTPQD